MSGFVESCSLEGTNGGRRLFVSRAGALGEYDVVNEGNFNVCVSSRCEIVDCGISVSTRVFLNKTSLFAISPTTCKNNNNNHKKKGQFTFSPSTKHASLAN
jgi:hypothetical protein